jgi:hypothetical protein
VRHGLLHLTLDVPTDDQLLDWANTAYKPLAGHVTFFEDDRQTARETVSFATGQCVSYQEFFVAGDGEAGAYVCQLLITRRLRPQRLASMAPLLPRLPPLWNG